MLYIHLGKVPPPCGLTQPSATETSGDREGSTLCTRHGADDTFVRQLPPHAAQAAAEAAVLAAQEAEDAAGGPGGDQPRPALRFRAILGLAANSGCAVAAHAALILAAGC